MPKAVLNLHLNPLFTLSKKVRKTPLNAITTQIHEYMILSSLFPIVNPLSQRFIGLFYQTNIILAIKFVNFSREHFYMLVLNEKINFTDSDLSYLTLSILQLLYCFDEDENPPKL